MKRLDLALFVWEIIKFSNSFVRWCIYIHTCNELIEDTVRHIFGLCKTRQPSFR